MRIDKDFYYLNIADVVSERSTCLRRKYGAVIVKDDEIIATGYNGAPRGRENCCDTGVCKREELCIPHGERYEMCNSLHAEQNAIISASRRDMLGSALYLAGREFNRDIIYRAMPCLMCKRAIINAGIAKVISKATEDSIQVIDVKRW